MPLSCCPPCHSSLGSCALSWPWQVPCGGGIGRGRCCSGGVETGDWAHASGTITKDNRDTYIGLVHGLPTSHTLSGRGSLISDDAGLHPLSGFAPRKLPSTRWLPLLWCRSGFILSTSTILSLATTLMVAPFVRCSPVSWRLSPPGSTQRQGLWCRRLSGPCCTRRHWGERQGATGGKIWRFGMRQGFEAVQLHTDVSSGACRLRRW